ncbi:MAG: hypothetical protein ACJ8J7_09265 [Sulfurifustaceae bacterium]
MERRLVFIMAMAMFLSGCAGQRPTSTTTWNAEPPLRAADPEREAAVTQASNVERLVVYADRLRWIAPPMLDTERASAEIALGHAPTAVNKVKLALVLMLRRAPFRDDTRARELLSQAAKDPGPDGQPMRSLATWLLQELDDRWAGERQLEEERRQRALLQRKVDQLKALEEEMDRRSAPPPVVAPR